MAVLPVLSDGSLPQLYDCAINGVGYRVFWAIAKNLVFKHDPYSESGEDIVVEKRDNATEEMSENKLDLLYWRSQRSWHLGAGQLRFDVPKAAGPGASDPSAFFSSIGLDLRVPGQATLLRGTQGGTPTVLGGMAFGDGQTRAAALVSASGLLYAVSSLTGQLITPPTTDAGAFTQATLTAAVTPTDVCSDGSNIFVTQPTAGTPNVSRSVAGAAFAIWASGAVANGGPAVFDARTIAWCKGRLVGAGLFSGAIGSPTQQWYLFQAGPGAGSVPAAIGTASGGGATLPPGYAVPHNCIIELAGFVLFGVASNHQSLIYAWDGFSAPYVCAYLPEGDQITSMEAFLGVQCCIGVRRIKTTGGTAANPIGNGVFYVAQMTGAGQLVLAEVCEIGDNGQPLTLAPGATTDTNDYAVTSIVTRGRYSYFTWQPFGLGCYDHANQSYHRFTGQFNTPASPPLIGDVCVVGRRLAFSTTFSITTLSVQVENINTLVNSGSIIGSVMDWNIDKQKTINQAEIGFTPLPAGTSAALDFSTDGAQTFTNALTDTTAGDTLASTANTLTSQFAQTVAAIQYRATLTSDVATHTRTPTLKKAGFGAWYGSKPKKRFAIALDVTDRQVLRNDAPLVLRGAPQPIQGPAPTTGDQIITNIRALRDSQTVVSFQPPGYGDTNTSIFVVQVRDYVVYRWYEESQTGPGFWGQVIYVEMKEAP